MKISWSEPHRRGDPETPADGFPDPAQSLFVTFFLRHIGLDREVVSGLDSPQKLRENRIGVERGSTFLGEERQVALPCARLLWWKRSRLQERFQNRLRVVLA